MSSGLAEAFILANMLGNDHAFDNRRRRSDSPFDDFRRYQDWVDRKAEVKEKKEKEKKDKDKEKKPGGLTYLEGVFWLFFLSPIVGSLWFNLETAIRTIH